MNLERVCVHELFETSAAVTPDSIALVAGSSQLTYRELNGRANQLARFLRANGVGPEVLVGLCLRRTADMLVAILGILKAGGAYVPMDPSYPAERLSLIMENSQTKILITTADLTKMFPAANARVVRIDADWPSMAKESQTNLNSTTNSGNLAYVIYTSGSTGKPKGVMITHAGLVNYLLWSAKAYGPEAQRSALVHSSISFDLTITGLFTPLLLGGRVELLAEDAGIDSLLAALRSDKVYGLIKITPAHLVLLSKQLDSHEVAEKVGLFVIGGENLEAEMLRFWREASPSTRLINEYGPTETVVGCCTYEVRTSDLNVGSVPIGEAIDNTQLHILDAELRPVGPGVAGELYIGGAGVARGYLNLPELTEQRFLADPFSPQPGARIYRTGDLARRRESGILEYLGRLDDQVQFHGHRIELGEIEATIAEHPAVHQSAAVLLEESLNQRLVGYVVRREKHAVSREQLREFLRQKLPNYMVPGSIFFRDALPLTLNGKIDRRALSAPEMRIVEHHGAVLGPGNDVESKLITIFGELFQASTISVTDSFFDLGGDSFLAVELLLRIERAFGKCLPMAAVFEAPTIIQLARVLQDQWFAFSEVIPVQSTGSLPPFFCFGAGPLFRPLAIRLGTERPFLGLAPTLRLPPPYKLEYIAAESVRVIREYQPEGPYYLGGWSAYGVVAYEIAQQLIAAGHDCNLLALFDVKHPAHLQQPSLGERREARRQKMRFFAKEVKELKLRQLSSYMGEKVTSLKRKVRQSSWKMTGALGDQEAAIHAAVGAYRPLPYPGKVEFFSAASRPDGRAWDFSQGWQHLVAGLFEVHEVPGDHLSMFSESNVASIAEKMSMCF